MNARQATQALTLATGLLLCPAAFAQDSFGGSRQTPPPAKAPAPSAPTTPTAPARTTPSTPQSAPSPTPAPRTGSSTPPRQQQAPANAAGAAELQDFGIAPARQLHNGPMHGPTPTTLPGGLVVTTGALSQLLQRRDSGVLLFDVLGSGESLPNALQAAWLAQPGTFNDPVQQQLVQGLQFQTGGRRDVPLVFYCASTQCWMSYNAALRAVNAGYANVLWYRGGIEAWKAAGLPTMQAGPGR